MLICSWSKPNQIGSMRWHSICNMHKKRTIQRKLKELSSNIDKVSAVSSCKVKGLDRIEFLDILFRGQRDQWDGGVDGDVIRKAADGVGGLLEKAFLAPFKTTFGGSCDFIILLSIIQAGVISMH
ncbi:hypothetical protein GBA52_026698 [Prunus armeniaca]|nr:hypothetical protein GBA52_026698 [Prunus armeniaca]